MKRILKLRYAVVSLIIMGTGLVAAFAGERMTENFNRGWKFNLGDVPEAKAADFDDSTWRDIKVPHDWSVELSFTTEETGGCTAFLPGGIGWYRKTFTVPESSKGKLIRVEFDGVYNNADVWINGNHLGQRPYGYSPFSYEFSEHLNFGGENTIVVKADRSAYMDCRWYPGSGIYRDVKLVTFDPLHIPQWGIFVSTEKNVVTVKTLAANETKEHKSVTVQTELKDHAGNLVDIQQNVISLNKGQSKEIEQVFEVADAQLWSPDSPYLYTAEVSLLDEKAATDDAVVTFGIRDIRFDPKEGFFLNGENMLIKGVCLHHDAGCVGAAVPIGMWEQRLKLLKDGGCNGIRTAHNPPSEEFLDLCDRMGFLVQDEAFDEWQYPKDKKYNFNQKVADERTLGYSEHFEEWGERDVKDMVLRDRNHPSIIMWSIGNEIEWTDPAYTQSTGYWGDDENKADYYLDEPPLKDKEMKRRFKEKIDGKDELGQSSINLTKWIKEVDDTRPVTANSVVPSVSSFTDFIKDLDIVGYSYRTAVYDYCLKRYPEKMIFGSENWTQWNEWKAVLDHKEIPGIYLWTGIDYMGESLEWPSRSSYSGLLSTAGFPKQSYWFYKTLWNDEPMVHIACEPLKGSNYKLKNSGEIVENPDNPRTYKWGWANVHNHWNFEDDEQVYVEVYSNCDETELFLNDKSLGTQKVNECDDRLMKWVVPFEGGTLKAVGRNKGQEVSSQILKTAGEPAGIKLTTDQIKLNANGVDVAHCTARLIDADGNEIKNVEQTITFKIEGDARNLGVDNGARNSTQDFQSDQCTTHKGRCLMVLQAGDTKGNIKITASAEGLKEATCELQQR